jgi:hypothetical protein
MVQKRYGNQWKTVPAVAYIYVLGEISETSLRK